MDLRKLEELLAAYKRNDLETTEAARRIGELHYEDIGYARVDHSRSTRQGFPEVVFGAGKTRAQVVGIVERLVQNSPTFWLPILTKVPLARCEISLPEAEWHQTARLIESRDNTELGGRDCCGMGQYQRHTIAAEAALTAEDGQSGEARGTGVAGIHRAGRASLLQQARVAIVVAGMEGALPSVVGGLVSVPVIAVPTSAGYGASFGGVAALLGMLTHAPQT